MTQEDPVLARLAALATPTPPAQRSEKIRVASLVALCPRPLHPVWALLVASSTLGYLGSALYFALTLY